ncbi:ARM repeat-containing protein [Obba rivulosa]|uniref:ARM repeat-containing protein n=1 Tax=Obba rivulosa TaxID=1052685 RepID=A0A8E2DKP4_9APHY|nr:ARM repeat-containing protein [Obba rivulosa]
MDYLRTLGSAAVSSLVQKSGLTLPFSLGTKVTSFENPSWTLYDATKRDDGSQVSVFEFDANTPAKKNYLPLAKNALRKLRTVRHPDVLRFMDAVETDTTIHIMTERVRPLASAISTWSAKGAQEREEWLIWGLHRISVALTFVNDSCASTHGNVRVGSIFISATGEWKLGGFDALSSPKDDAAVLYTLGSVIPDAMSYASPEVKNKGWSVLKEHEPAVADSYALGLLIHCIFNPSAPLPATAQPPHPPPTASSRGAIPIALFPSFKKLLNPNPKARLTPKHLLELGMSQTAGEGSGVFANNRLVKICSGLDNFNLGNESEKVVFLRTLKESASSFPQEFAAQRVLPSLTSALEFGGASAATILPLVMQFGKGVPPEDYSSAILVHLVKLYASPDRGTRMALLDHLPEYADKLDKKTVVDKIWPNLQTGFSDTVALIREATVRSIILLSDKLNERILNNDLLRYLAKMQADPEPSIRTNTCILIGRLGPSLGYNTKRKVLVPAFARALKDPFVHARVAGLMALMATIECFDAEDLASKVIPNMSSTMVDTEKLVRDQAFKTMELFIKRLEEHATTMPETAAPETEALPLGLPPSSPGSNALVNSAAGAASALAGWAISSLGKKLAAADLQSTMDTNVGAEIDRPTSAPASGDALRPLASTFASAASSSHLGAKPGAKGMQLGAHKVPASVSAAALAAEWADEAVADAAQINYWGSDDLMDVNADQDDWSAFETAPVINSSSLSSTPNGAKDLWGDRGFTSPDPADDFLKPASKVSKPLHSPRPVYLNTPRSPSPLIANRNSRQPRSATPSESDAGEHTAPQKAVSTAGMTKEEKAAEMARRKEERRQRIAALKEAKKSVATPAP